MGGGGWTGVLRRKKILPIGKQVTRPLGSTDTMRRSAISAVLSPFASVLPFLMNVSFYDLCGVLCQK